MIWSPDEVLAAVRATLSVDDRHQPFAFEHADLDGDRVLVVFRIDDQHRFGVHYSLADLPVGPNTGEPVGTPEEWATELGWDMDEQVHTGGIDRAERVSGQDDLILLRWRW